jgi:hypothetical protein
LFLLQVFFITSLDLKKGDKFIADRDCKVIYEEEIKFTLQLQTDNETLKAKLDILNSRIEQYKSNEVSFNLKISSFQTEIELWKGKYNTLNDYLTKQEIKWSGFEVEKKFVYGSLTFTLSLSVVELGACIMLGTLLYYSYK